LRLEQIGNFTPDTRFRHGEGGDLKGGNLKGGNLTVAVGPPAACGQPARLRSVGNPASILRNGLLVLDAAAAVGKSFGERRGSLLDAGTLVPEMDLLIAGTAIVHGLIPITHNVRDFAVVPGLLAQDWLLP
jgi:hypothetical protein